MARTIGTLAEETDVDVETIRYYHRIDLLEKPPKPAEGWRTYPEQAVRRIRFIKRAQGLGFSLDEIRELLALSSGDEDAEVCEQSRAIVDEKLREVRRKIENLRQIEDSLAQLREDCPGEGTADECPILEGFRFGDGGAV